MEVESTMAAAAAAVAAAEAVAMIPPPRLLLVRRGRTLRPAQLQGREARLTEMECDIMVTVSSVVEEEYQMNGVWPTFSERR